MSNLDEILLDEISAVKDYPCIVLCLEPNFGVQKIPGIRDFFVIRLFLLLGE